MIQIGHLLIFKLAPFFPSVDRISHH